MKAVSVQKMRELEAQAMASGISGFSLMESAGIRAAEIIAREAVRRRCRSVTVVTGKGNNAGDGYAAAAHLPGLDVRVVTPIPPDMLKGDAGRHAALLPDHIPVHVCPKPVDFPAGTLIVDALLGTGFSGEVREPLLSFVRAVNASGNPVVSLDLPSGLDGDSGDAAEAVQSHATVTFGLPKAGLFRKRGPELAGVIHTACIGIPDKLIAGIPGEFDTVCRQDITPLLKPLRFDDYKNSRGRVIVTGGSEAYPGAPLLSALGAMRAGAGFVRLAVPAIPYGNIPAALVVHKLSANKGFAGKKAALELERLLPLADAVAAGPGWGDGRELTSVLKIILESQLPAVLDADALNLLAREPGLEITGTNTILTPHIGEAGRLYYAGCSDKMPSCRTELALRLAETYRSTVILKGVQSVVAAPDGRFAVNTSGTAALGICGSGDVLTGVTAAMLASGMNAYDAARTAVYLHGRAGDTLPRRGLVADELPQLVRNAMLEISPLS